MEFEVKDISLAEWGRKEIQLAEHEMPGLMSLRKRYGTTKPLKGARITGSLHMTVQTAVLIETLQDLGADIRWASCNIYSTQDQAAAAVAKGREEGTSRGGVPVFAWSGETIEEYWDLLYKAFCFYEGKGPNLIVDDGGDATLLLHRGYELEHGDNWVYLESKNEEERCIRNVLKKIHAEDAGFWTRVVESLRGISEETTTGVLRLRLREEQNTLLVPAINVNDSVTKSKFDNLYGCRESIVDAIRRATDITLSGKTAVVCGYGNVGKGVAQAFRGCYTRVLVTEIDPICALQAAMEGYEVCKMEKALSIGDIFVTTTGNYHVINEQHMRQMRNQAIVCNIGHFDNEIDIASLERASDITKQNIKPLVDLYSFETEGHSILLLAGGRLVNLGCATGHPSFIMSISFTNQVLAQMTLWQETHKPQMYLLDKRIDEEVATLHLAALGAEIDSITSEQGEYIAVNVAGPFKHEQYRY